MRLRSAAIAVAVLSLAGPGALRAQDVVSITWLYLRGSPSKTGARLRTLPPNDTLSLRTVPPRPGWLPVRTRDGKAGWVGEVYVRDLSAAAAGAATTVVSDSAAGAAGAAGRAGGGATGGAANRIDAAWAKPPLVTSTIWVKGGAESCGPTGDGTDDGTNFQKNRADAPGTSHLVMLDAIRALPDTALWPHKGRSHWTAADSALVIPYEGIPVTVEGYFEIVKPQQTSAPTGTNKVGEAPNCHSWDEMDTDWHIALVADPSETEERAVVVEPTPRSKRHNAGWTVAAAKALAVRSSPSAPRNESGAARVRVTGYLMLDPVHPNHISGGCAATQCSATKFYRATLWEVHPVTRIEVWKNNAWVNLNDLPPPP